MSAASVLSGTDFRRRCDRSVSVGAGVCWLILPALFCLSLIRDCAAADSVRRPNIVFIMADDLGYTDVACFGSRYYETPNIDRLAAEGLKLTSHHHCQNCAPTRAALMTGQYGPRTGVYTVGGTDRFDTSERPLIPVENITALPLDRAIIAHQLKQAGYITGMFGKWHLGENGQHHPGKRGFDEAVVTSANHLRYQTNPPTEHPEGQYLADFLTDKAVDFIQRHREEPFFLYVPHFGVHSPYQAKADLKAHFDDKSAVGGHNDPTYAAMIASVDESVGRIVKTLEDLKLTEQTIVIFTSDNGGVGGYKREGIASGARDVTDNAPLRSGKGSLYEGGTRVPFIVRWPGVVAAGTSSNVPTIHVDLYPTWLELAGAPAPEHVLDGESLVSLWKTPASSLKRPAIFQHFPGYLGSGKQYWRTTPVTIMQQGDWKLMEFLEDHHLELYNLDADIGETRNLAMMEPERARDMHAQMAAWRDSIHAPMPERRPEGAETSGAASNKAAGKGKKARRKNDKMMED